MNYFFGLLLIISSFSIEVNAQNFNHESWSKLLAANVNAAGNVNYKGFQSDLTKLDAYLTLLSNTSPDEKSWSTNEQLAFWINAYNAFTIKLILNNYPVKSINDIASPWDKKFFTIGGKKMSLNFIEHQILRKKFKEPRIHFAIVCASYSCPKLLNLAYSANDLNSQLSRATATFINDSKRNLITTEKAQLSELFNWFKSDFTKTSTLIEFINQYSSVKITKDTKITYLPYNWNLNN